MKTERTIVCGGLDLAGLEPGGDVLRLNIWPGAGRDINVKVGLEELRDWLCDNIAPQFLDLVDIAAYVYCADQMVKRDDADPDTFGANWRRRFHFHIPVRVPDLWSSTKATAALRELVEFLSDDFYDFTFYPAEKPPVAQLYLGLDEMGRKQFNADTVMLFSGGLDSLAGAVKECVTEGRRVVLVNHQAADKFAARHAELVKRLNEKAGTAPPLHVRVEITKWGLKAADYNQRARSFLFAAVGATVAWTLGKRAVRFYENGVVSLNLPVCAQVVGSRATRTTHPRTIAFMRRLFSLVAGEPFGVDNPFLWETKGEIIQRIVKAECGELIGWSRSCAETWHRSNEQPHCGVCSQCIDRRFGILAADAEAHDPVEGYEVKMFTQSQPKDRDKIMLASFLERANQVGRMQDVETFLESYPEVTRALKYLEQGPARGAELMLKLYQRHAAEVNKGVEIMQGRYRKEIRERTLPEDCLLRTVLDARSVNVVPAAPVNGAEAKRLDGEAQATQDSQMTAAAVFISQKVVEGLRPTMENIDRSMEAVAKGDYELRKENENLKWMVAGGYFKFVAQVDKEDFVAFAFIMAFGNRKAAAERLQVPQRTFYQRVEKWAGKGPEYKEMIRWVTWRKQAGLHATVPLGESLLSGEPNDKPENPNTMDAVLTNILHDDRDSREDLLCQIFEALKEANEGNWRSIARELMELIQEEVPQ